MSGNLRICAGVTVHSFGVESICLTKPCSGKTIRGFTAFYQSDLRDGCRLSQHPWRRTAHSHGMSILKNVDLSLPTTKYHPSSLSFLALSLSLQAFFEVNSERIPDCSKLPED